MQPVHAVNRADEFIKLMLQHQQDLFGRSALNTEQGAQDVAKALAALRQELIARLSPQEG